MVQKNTQGYTKISYRPLTDNNIAKFCLARYTAASLKTLTPQYSKAWSPFPHFEGKGSRGTSHVVRVICPSFPTFARTRSTGCRTFFSDYPYKANSCRKLAFQHSWIDMRARKQIFGDHVFITWQWLIIQICIKLYYTVVWVFWAMPQYSALDK